MSLSKIETLPLQKDVDKVLHIYTRISSALQLDGTSLDNQKNLGIQKSLDLKFTNDKFKGYKIWNEEVASSNYEDFANRPVMFSLLEDIERGLVKHLYAFDDDRLSRNESTQFEIKTALTKNNVVLYTNKSTTDFENPTDRLIKSVFDAFASYENQMRSVRTRMGRVQRVKEGFWYGAPPPYGYEIKEKKLSIHPEESKWVNFMFKSFADGKRQIDIKNELDKKGVIARRGGMFNVGSINRLFDNTHYKGYFTFTDSLNNETLEIVCPKIIDDSLWEKVAEQKKKILERKNQNAKTTNFYLLRDLLVCECGTRMSGRIAPLRGERNYYCANKTRAWKNGVIPEDVKWKRGKVGDYGCNNTKSMNIDATDDFVWGEVKKIISKSSILKKEFKDEYLGKVKTYKSYTTEIGLEDRKLQRHQKELTQINKTLGDVETAYRLGEYESEDTFKRINDNLTKRKIKIEEQLEEVKVRKKVIADERNWVDWVKKFGDKILDFENISPDIHKEYLTGIIDKIIVSLNQETKLHELNIHFNLPIVEDGIKYKNLNKKKSGYEVVEGSRDIGFNMPKIEVRGRKKKSEELVQSINPHNPTNRLRLNSF